MLRQQTAPTIITVLLFVAALMLGGAAAAAVSTCATIALFALVATGWTRNERKDLLVLAALVVLGVTALQLIPLPPFVLKLVNARSEALTARALSPMREDLSATWRALHLDPANGWSYAQYLIGLLAAYVAAKQVTLRGESGPIRLGAAWATAAIAIVAIAHKVTGQTELFGIYQLREAAPNLLAPLLNPNHLSAYTGAGAILWAGFALEGVYRGLAVPLSVLCGAVCVASVSRGGVAGAVTGFAVLALCHGALLRRMSMRRSGKDISAALQAIALAVLVLIGGALAGFSALVQEHRASGFSKLSLMLQFLGTTREHRLSGTGIGGLYAAVSGSTITTPTTGALADNNVPFAENFALDLVLGIGPIAALLAMGLGARWLYTVRPKIRSSQPEDFSVFAAIVSLLVHDLFDYALWLGASGYLFAVLAGIQSGLRVYVPPQRGEIRVEETNIRRARNRTRVASLIACALSAATGIFIARLTNTLEREHWQQVAKGSTFDEPALRRAMRRHPADPVLPMAGASLALRTRNPRALRYINRVIELAPAWSQTHILLAQILASRGQRSQALLEARLAVHISYRYHSTAARLLLALQATDEELDRFIPPGPLGTAFLKVFGTEANGTPRAASIDERLLARAPNELAPWTRVAARARAANDVAAETRAWEQIIRVHPSDATGCIGLADMHLATPASTQTADAAEQALRRCPMSAHSDPRYLRRMAVLRARRNDTVGMRRTIDLLLESYGADADRRIEAFALRGLLELELRNDSAALQSYELADSMSAPRHPYLPDVIRIAHSMGDMGRVRNACLTLREDAELPADLRSRCNEAATGSSPLPPPPITP